MRTELIFLCLSVASLADAAPRFHATQVLRGVGDIWGFANDGAIGVSTFQYGDAIYYNGQWTNYGSLTNYDYSVAAGLTAHDIFSGYGRKNAGDPLVAISYYKGTTREVAPGGMYDHDRATYTNASGDFVGYRYDDRIDPNTGSTHAKPFVVHNGQLKFLADYQDDPGGNLSAYATGITDGGIIYGNKSRSPRQFGGYGFFYPSGSASPTWLLNGAIVRGFDDRVFIATGQSGSGVSIVGSNGIGTPVEPPSGTSIDQPDMNSRHQVVARSGLNPIVYWENGQSYFMNSLLDNPEVMANATTWDEPRINDSGSIICRMTFKSDNYFSLFRFDPIAVPEPSSILVIGIGALALRRRSRS